MVFVPGFSQPPDVWDDVLAALEPLVVGLDAVALDVPDGADFADTAQALGAVGGPGVYIGYSMGGRLALRLALDRPDLVEGLVLVSATPGIADIRERAARAASDERLAEDVTRSGVEDFLTRWLAQPLFATLPPERSKLDARATWATPARLAHQMRSLGQGVMEPLWNRLAALDVPVLVVSGERDERYCAIGDEIARRVRGAEAVRLAGGHALPLEAPDALAREIARFSHHDSDAGEA
ncbi:MAG TPA: alpha/beta fold hydrolase [Acidimicrobiia bacterium]|nr:alpha/beta fold hydrolase [Acidimicrobiia bacterium]